MNTFVLCI
jgi:hypothetical protein